MKKVVLLGDSIRQIGYGTRIEEFLGDEYAVWQPDDNCRYSFYTLRMLRDFPKEIKGADVIHWNNGLWDICEWYGDGTMVPLDIYVATMKRIAKILQSWGKKVIFATTTPIKEGSIYMSNKNICEYNAALVPVLQDMGVIIHDLHSFVADNIKEFIKDEDLLHLTPTGIEACARRVAEVIKTELEE